MATKKKADKAPKKVNARYVVTTNGQEFRILREDGKYLYCEGAQFRHNGSQIREIVAREAETEAE